MDDFSTESIKLTEQFGGDEFNVETIRLDSPHLYAAAVNYGLLRVTDEHVIILNNDTIVTKDFIADAYRNLYNARFAIYGPLTNKCAGVQQIKLKYNMDWNEDNLNAALRNGNGLEFDEVVNEIEIAFEQYLSKRSEQYTFHLWINGFCLIIPNQIIKKVGIFNSQLFPLSGEEMDYCIRAVRMGACCVVDPEMFVYHMKHETAKELSDQSKTADDWWRQAAQKIKYLYPNIDVGDQQNYEQAYKKERL